MKSTICSGALFYNLQYKRFLFLHRTQSKKSNLWGLVGGTNEKQETPWEGLKREIFEEIGKVEIKKILPLETFVAQNNLFKYHTYLCICEKEFIPYLNHEHDGYAWVKYLKWPRPLHFGLKNTLIKKHNKQKIETVIEILDLLDN
jgi:8-oxo-dGTP pyrophosphatase MutT (NUDIX family)